MCVCVWTGECGKCVVKRFEWSINWNSAIEMQVHLPFILTFSPKISEPVHVGPTGTHFLLGWIEAKPEVEEVNPLVLYQNPSFPLPVPLNTLGTFRRRSALLVIDPFHCGSIAERTGPLLSSESSAQSVGSTEPAAPAPWKPPALAQCKLSNVWWWETGKSRAAAAPSSTLSRTDWVERPRMDGWWEAAM